MTTVAELARRLKSRHLDSRHRARPWLPPLLLLTDERRLADPRPFVELLAGLGGLVLRHYADPHRAVLAAELAPLCRRAGVPFLIAADPALAAAVRADGVHFPEALAARAAGLRAARPRWLITAAAHGAAALGRAKLAGADAALLSPFFATPSHPDERPLGPVKGARLVRTAGLPVYALGGIDPAAARRLQPLELCGFAGIGGLMGSPGQASPVRVLPI